MMTTYMRAMRGEVDDGHLYMRAMREGRWMMTTYVHEDYERRGG